MWGLLTLIVSVIAVAFAFWRFFTKEREDKTINKAQLQLSTEPDIILHVAMPNHDPIKISCLNRGVAVYDVYFQIEGSPQEQHESLLNGSNEIWFELPRVLLKDKESVHLTISYNDKLKPLRFRQKYEVPGAQGS